MGHVVKTADKDAASLSTDGQDKNGALNNPSKLKAQSLIEGPRMKEVCQNLSICQDALIRIKMDLMQSTRLRERKQLETIILHLLDAIRCHTDGGDLIYEINEAKMQSRKRSKKRVEAKHAAGDGQTE